MKIACPHCGVELKVHDNVSGRVIRCPQCQKKMRVAEPAPKSAGALRTGKPGKAGDKGGAASERPRASSNVFAPVVPPARVRRTRPQKTTTFVGTDGDDETQGRPRRTRSRGRSISRMLAGLVSGPFWQSALGHLPYMTAALFCAGGLIGFIVGIVKSAAVAGLMFQLIGLPTTLGLFLLMSYPTSCFWKVIVGSAHSDVDIAEWPAGSSFGEWVFELLFVGYLIGISAVPSMGVGKLCEWTIPEESRSEDYWSLIAKETEVEQVRIFKLVPAFEFESHPAVIRPGTGWQITFAAFVLFFPLVVMSCMDSDTPAFVPWSPRVWLSLVTNFPAWCVTLFISGMVLLAAAVVFIVGATYAPFLTYTLTSPLAAAGMLTYGRLVGLLSWQITGD